ncbi:MAG: hypothetical protein A2Y41_06860 [Spirochaetes bacterium GWB1_36_13]|nr:MAG: hypothetical protein A2Y41_06860 [Spirochaetes bacterium GWB1_36_13]
MKQKHFNIPIFIPELACPFQCIFCNQKKITGQASIPSEKEITNLIEKYLKTIDTQKSAVEIAFFGGNFTGLPLAKQETLLKAVTPYFHSGISGIRISTRPDFINKNNLSLLKSYSVQTIELGIQSFDDEVLEKSKRGYDSKKAVSACRMVKKMGFNLGIQMMSGLPGSTLEKEMETAFYASRLQADMARIYPVVVIRDTVLEKLFDEKKYLPLSLNEAVKRSCLLLQYFESKNIPVIRLGLHPSEGLLSGRDIVSGPFHPSFRELVYSEIWKSILSPLLEEREKKSKKLTLRVSPSEVNYVSGYDSCNKIMLLNFFSRVRILPSEKLNGRYYETEWS